MRIKLPLPFSLRSVNAWLFPGHSPALVDCGLGTDENYNLLMQGIRGADVNPAELRLFITHGHVDHAGNAARLNRDHGIQLHAPREEAPFVETFRRDSPGRNDAYRDAMLMHGMPAHAADQLRAGSDAFDSYLEDQAIAHDVPDGARIQLGDDEATAVRTPGHTDGSTCFWLSEDNDMLTGDTLLEHITSNAIELLDSDHGTFHQYLQTLESCRRFVGVDCLPGHWDSFRLTDAMLDNHMELHRQRRARLLGFLDKPQTAWELLPKMFPRKNTPDHWFLAMAELVGHLHSAEMDGLVARKESGGVRRFQK